MITQIMERDRERDRETVPPSFEVPPSFQVPSTVPIPCHPGECMPLRDLMRIDYSAPPGRQGAQQRAADLAIVDTGGERLSTLKWMDDYNASDEQCAHFIPRVNGKARRWAEMLVGEYLFETYSVRDAMLIRVERTTKGYIWFFTGLCPHHRKYHDKNRWTLTQFDNNQAYTVFRCFQDSTVRRTGYLPLDATNAQVEVRSDPLN